MSISDVVNVSIKVQDSVPSEAGFGIPALFASVDGAFSGWKTYSADEDGLTSLLADGVALGSAAYKAANAIAAQDPKVESFKVYARTTHATQAEKHTPTILTQGYTYSFELSDGTETATVERTNGASETANTISTAIAALVTAASVGTVTGAHAGTDGFYTLAPGSTTRFYTKNPSRGLTVEDTSLDGGIATDLTAAVALDDDWFGLLLDTTSKAEIVAAAAFAESNKKVFVGNSKDTAIILGTAANAALTIQGSGYDFTSVFYESDDGSYPAAGLISRELSQDPGSSSFHGKRIKGTTPDNLTEGELTTARSANALTYVTVKGIPFTFDGRAGSGRFLDITIGIEWLKSIIQDAVLTLIANAEKIPFTNVGISQVVSVINGCLARAESVGLLAPGWSTTAPDAADVDLTNKGNRILPDVKFQATLAGAIHKVVVKGTVSL